MGILIKNISLLPMTEEKVIDNTNIFIEDGKIKYIGDNTENLEINRVIDGQNKLAMPGLINAHTHVGMSLLRNYADDLPLFEWLSERIWPVEDNLTAEDVYWGSLLSMVEMIESGTTTFCDMYFFMDEVGKAAEKIGMRSVLTRGMVEDKKNPDKSLIESEELFNNWNNKNDGMFKVLIAPHAPYTCSTEFLVKCLNLAKKLNTGIHIHLSETDKEVEDSINEFGKSPIKRLNDLGIFDVHTVGAHCVSLSDEDINIIKEKNLYPVNNPGSNLKLASGFAPIDKMLKEGIPVALGTDGSSSNNNLNMFEEINLAAIINKAVNLDAVSVSAYDALKMATINGAKALGIEDKVGTIEEGKQADIILIDLDKSHLYPRHNLISAMSYSAQGSDVDTVIINGNIIMENRKIKSVDVEEVKYMAEKLAKDLINR